MSTKATKADSDDFTAPIIRALRRAAKTARKTAAQFGTPIYISRAGKIVAIKPERK